MLEDPFVKPDLMSTPAEIPMNAMNSSITGDYPKKRTREATISKGNCVSANDSLSPCTFSIPIPKCAEPLPIFVEACCGSAKLSFEVKARGIFVLPVDWIQNKHRTRVSAMKLDLSSKSQVAILSRLVEQGLVKVVWAAIPCGTASKAREIRLSKSHHGPKPLRSYEFPEGLPNLSPRDQERVKKANEIYDAVSDLLQLALDRGCLIAVENPRGSYVWEYKWYKKLISVKDIFDVDYQHCKWTPLLPCRPKWTRVRTNIRQLVSMQGPCQQEHRHLGWGMDEDGKFATSNETEYPDEMCSEAADRIALAITDMGYVLTAAKPDLNILSSEPHKRRRAVVNKQPRGRKLPPVLPEFKEIQEMTFAQSKSLQAKVLRIVDPVHGIRNGEQDMQGSNEQEPFISSLKVPREEMIALIEPNDKVIAGIFHTPEEFFDKAKNAVHPLDMDGAIPDELVYAAKNVLECNPAELVKHLLVKTRELIKLVEDCKSDDAQILEMMEPRMAKVMKNKKFATMQKLLEKTQHPDVNIVADMIKGFDLVGIAEYTNSFDYVVKLPNKSVSELRELSYINNAAIMDRCKPAKNPEADAEIWKQVEEEIDQGWLLGKCYSIEEAHRIVGSYPHLSRRFPLIQTDKVRAIDDLLESMVNSSWGSYEKLNLLDADSVAALIRHVEKVFKEKEISTVTRVGTKVQTKLHSAWTTSGNWQGRTVDLKAAYKQLCVKPECWWACVLAVYDSDNDSICLVPEITLPFGSAASVLHFNRAARLLWRIGVCEFSFLWCNFYDDYPTISCSSTSKSVQAAITIFLKAVGWNFSDKPGKDIPFDEAFNALGIKFDVSRIPRGESTVENRPDKKDSFLTERNYCLRYLLPLSS